MIKVYTHTDRPGRRYAPTGDGTIRTYQEEIKDGRKLNNYCIEKC